MAGRIFMKFSVDVAKTMCQRATCRFLRFPICSLASATYVIFLLLLLVLRIMGGLSPNFAYMSWRQLAKILCVHFSVFRHISLVAPSTHFFSCCFKTCLLNTQQLGTAWSHLNTHLARSQVLKIRCCIIPPGMLHNTTWQAVNLIGCLLKEI